MEKKPDDKPPTSPTNLHIERSTSTSIKITWNESEDESGIYCYYIYRDGERIGSTRNLYYVDTGLKSHSQHLYYVIACDIDGNMSEKSDIIEAATDADEYAPTQPANLTAVVKGDSTIYLSWIASSDNVKVLSTTFTATGFLLPRPRVQLILIKMLLQGFTHTMLKLLIMMVMYQRQVKRSLLITKPPQSLL